MARSVARLNAPTNSGTSRGIIALARAIRLPLSKSAPRAICAFMILSASSSSVGMKRSAMVIIIASSCEGKRSFDSGRIMRSRPSVSTTGDVVNVSIEVPITRNTRRSEKKTAFCSPSFVSFKKPQLKSTVSPVEKSRLMTNVKTMMNRSALMPRIRKPRLISAILAIPSRNRKASA